MICNIMQYILTSYLPHLEELYFDSFVSSEDAMHGVKGCFTLSTQGSWSQLNPQVSLNMSGF